MFRIIASYIQVLVPSVSDDHPMTVKEYDQWNAAGTSHGVRWFTLRGRRGLMKLTRTLRLRMDIRPLSCRDEINTLLFRIGMSGREYS